MNSATVANIINLMNIGIEIASEPIAAVKKYRIIHLELIFKEFYEGMVSQYEALEENMQKVVRQYEASKESMQKVRSRGVINMQEVDKAISDAQNNKMRLARCAEYFYTFVSFIRSGEISETGGKHAECGDVLEKFFSEVVPNDYHIVPILKLIPTSRVSTVCVMQNKYNYFFTFPYSICY